jgi:hypothetical protein
LIYHVKVLPRRKNRYRLYTEASSMSTRERSGRARTQATVMTAAKTMYAEIAYGGRGELEGRPWIVRAISGRRRFAQSDIGGIDVYGSLPISLELIRQR